MFPFSLTLVDRVGRSFGKWRALRTAIHTERLLNELPVGIRKDIGWPDACGDRVAGPTRR